MTPAAKRHCCKDTRLIVSKAKTVFLFLTAAVLSGCAGTRQFVDIPTSSSINQTTARISLERMQEAGGSAVALVVLDDGCWLVK
jgi:uncharacterized protein YceK